MPPGRGSSGLGGLPVLVVARGRLLPSPESQPARLQGGGGTGGRRQHPISGRTSVAPHKKDMPCPPQALADRLSGSDLPCSRARRERGVAGLSFLQIDLAGGTDAALSMDHGSLGAAGAAARAEPSVAGAIVLLVEEKVSHAPGRVSGGLVPERACPPDRQGRRGRWHRGGTPTRATRPAQHEDPAHPPWREQRVPPMPFYPPSFSPIAPYRGYLADPSS